ncbi:hypothetical protein HYX12_02940 [Candidatus Woesearchaeota archaeon]|nr:hypothetical protein [Candidatus Woesearchaeota archaeon]
MTQGRISDLNFQAIVGQLYSQGAYFIMRNTSGLTSEEFEDIKVNPENPEMAEEEIIKEHLQQVRLFDKETEFLLTKSLLSALSTTKKEGETVTDFQRRIEQEMKQLLKI